MGDQIPRLRSAWVRLASLVLVLIALTGAFYLGRMSLTSLSQAGLPEPGDRTVMWTARTETLGRTISVSASMRREVAPGPPLLREGIVTGVFVKDGQVVQPGDRLLSVDLQPVIAGAGAVPAFRDLSLGVVGPDVAQLRALMCSVGKLRSCQPRDVFDVEVQRAVAAWEKERGLWPDGVVAAGDVMWFATMPAVVWPSLDLPIGTLVSAADRPFSVSTGEFTIEPAITPTQVAEIPNRAVVRLDGQIEGVVAEITSAPPSTSDPSAAPLRMRLVDPATGVPLCRADPRCDALIGQGAVATVDLAIEIVPSAEAIVVPRAAVLTDAGGNAYVELADGTRRPVEVGTTSNGLTAVTGVDVGDSVRLPDSET